MRNLRPPLARLNGQFSVVYTPTHYLQKSNLLVQISSVRRGFQIRIRMPDNRPLLNYCACRSLRVACLKYRFKLRKVPSQPSKSIVIKRWQQYSRNCEKGKSLKMKLGIPENETT